MMFVSGRPDTYWYEPIFSVLLLRAKTWGSFTPRKNGDIEV